MITLDSFPANTYFSGPDRQLKRMFRILRLKDKQAYWKAKFILRRVGYFAGTTKAKDRNKKIEEIYAKTKYIKFYNLRSNSFPTGLLPRVKKFLRKKNIAFQITRSGKTSKKLRPIKRFHFVDSVERREEQITAANAALEKQRGILHCATNAGKTEIACGITAELIRQREKMPRVLFLVHRIGLSIQTQKRFKQHLGDKIPVAQVYGGHKNIPKRGVVVATIQTITNMLYKSDALAKFMERCDCVFIDEFHLNKAWSVHHILERCEAPMRIGLSGTIRVKSAEKYLHYMGMTGPILAEVKNEELVRLGRSAKPFIRFRTITEPEVEGNYTESYREGIVRHVERNRMVVREAVRYLNKDKRVLITVARKAHGYRLLELFKQKLDVPCQFIQGSTSLYHRDEAVKKFVSNKAPILIVSPIGDVGWDLPEIQAWINAAGGSGWELVLQRLGRILRRKKDDNRVWMTDFLDYHSPYLRKHSKRRLKYYRAENIADIKILED